MDYVFLAIGGMIVGLFVAAPIGPVNLICIRRTLAHGPSEGFLSGLGAALADGLFAVIAMFGLTAIEQWIRGYSSYLVGAGGLILIGFGLHIFRAGVIDGTTSMEDVPDTTSSLGALVSTFALCIANPATFLGVTALLTGLTELLEVSPGPAASGITVAGVFLGSAGWWFAITAFVGIFHRGLDPKVMRRINHWMGIAVMAFGALVLANIFYPIF